MTREREIQAFRSALAEWRLIATTRARWGVRAKHQAYRIAVERLIGIVRERHDIEVLNLSRQLLPENRQPSLARALMGWKVWH